MSDVLVADVGVAQPARRETLDSLFAALPVVHVDGTARPARLRENPMTLP